MIYLVTQETCECIYYLTSACSTFALTNPTFCVLTSVALISSSQSAAHLSFGLTIESNPFILTHNVILKSHFLNSKFQKSIWEFCLYTMHRFFSSFSSGLGFWYFYLGSSAVVYYWGGGVMGGPQIPNPKLFDPSNPKSLNFWPLKSQIPKILTPQIPNPKKIYPSNPKSQICHSILLNY